MYTVTVKAQNMRPWPNLDPHMSCPVIWLCSMWNITTIGQKLWPPCGKTESHTLTYTHKPNYIFSVLNFWCWGFGCIPCRFKSEWNFGNCIYLARTFLKVPFWKGKTNSSYRLYWANSTNLKSYHHLFSHRHPWLATHLYREL